MTGLLYTFNQYLLLRSLITRISNVFLRFILQTYVSNQYTYMDIL